MAVRVHVLRTCDRCGRPIETDGAVPIQQLKEGDTIPVFQRAVLRVIREEPSMDGGEPTTKVLGKFTDICDPCTSVVERALDTLLKRHSDEDEAAASSGEVVAESKRKRAGRTPKAVASDMPGPNGSIPPAKPSTPAPLSGESSVDVAAAEAEAAAEAAALEAATGAAASGSEPLKPPSGDVQDEPF